MVRIGMIGSGFMAHTYSEVLTKHTHDGQLVAIAGGRRAPGLAEKYGVAVEPSVEALCARPDVDAVIITSPEQVRVEQTRLAAQAGKHVLSEKPMATTVAECDAMIHLCDQAGVTLMIIQSQRYRGVHVQAKQLIAEGKIGQVQQMRIWSVFPTQWTVPVVNDRPWYNDPNAGIFMSQCVHNFDMMRWLIGSNAKRVFAFAKSFQAHEHGLPNLTASALVEFENGAIGNLWASMELPGIVFPHSQFRSQLVGSQGLLDLEGYNYVDLGTAEGWRRVWEQPPFDPYNPLDPVRLVSFTNQIQAFIDCIVEKRPPDVPGSDGRAAVELCQAVLISARTGQPVELPLGVG